MSLTATLTAVMVMVYVSRSKVVGLSANVNLVGRGLTAV